MASVKNEAMRTDGGDPSRFYSKVISLLFVIALSTGDCTLLLAGEAQEAKGFAGTVAPGPKVELSIGEKNALCLGCHSRDRLTIWNGITHELEGVACSECHGTHKGAQRNRD